MYTPLLEMHSLERLTLGLLGIGLSQSDKQEIKD